VEVDTNTLLVAIGGVLVLILGAVMGSTLVGLVGAIVLIAAAERAWRHRKDRALPAPRRRP
jgi:hypothetical protein